MKIEQIYTTCLAQGADYIVSENEAIIIDPLREIQPYLDRTQQDNVTVKYILETHFHADFVSGHLDLAKATGAPIVFGPNANPDFEFYAAKDGEELYFGKLKIKVLHTPGHTMESTCYLLFNEENQPNALFSGDTLFVGDVGRPDLAQKATNLTQEELAGHLYDSLRQKIMTLPDEVTVYPAHGAGSACGKNMSKETSDTLGNQKKLNYALRSDMTKEEFVKEVIEGLLPPPGYFGMNVAMNKNGYESIEKVFERGLNPLSVKAFETLSSSDDILILDTRTASDFSQGFIPGSLFVGLEGQFAPWVGAVISDVKQKLVLVTPIGKEEETVKRLARVGYDNVLGYLDGSFASWLNAGKTIDKIGRITADELVEQKTKNKLVIDVRKPGEFEAEHLEDAVSAPLDFIYAELPKFPTNQPFILHCAGGYRSIIAGSILKMKGYNDFVDVIGGYNAISKTSLPRTNFVCQGKG